MCTLFPVEYTHLTTKLQIIIIASTNSTYTLCKVAPITQPNSLSTFVLMFR